MLLLKTLCLLLAAAGAATHPHHHRHHHGYQPQNYTWPQAQGYSECPEFRWWEARDNEVADGDVIADEDPEEWVSFVKYKYGDVNENEVYQDDVQEILRPGSDDDKTKPHKPVPLSQICDKRGCPVFEKLDIPGSCGFEARRIPAALWAVTEIDSSDIHGTYREAYMRLRTYSMGNNVDGTKVRVGLPIITIYDLDDNFNPVRAFMYFYLTSQEAPLPVPTDPRVGFTILDEMVVYDRAFGGSSNQQRYERAFTYLARALVKEGVSYDPYTAVMAGYTSPWSTYQRSEALYTGTGTPGPRTPGPTPVYIPYYWTYPDE